MLCKTETTGDVSKKTRQWKQLVWDSAATCYLGSSIQTEQSLVVSFCWIKGKIKKQWGWEKTRLHLSCHIIYFHFFSSALCSMCSPLAAFEWASRSGILSCISIIALSIICRGISFLLCDQVTALGMMLAASALQSDGLHLSRVSVYPSAVVRSRKGRVGDLQGSGYVVFANRLS